LAKRLAFQKVPLPLEGSTYTSAAGNPLWGQEAALRGLEAIEHIFVDADIALLAATLGGGTGAGALPVIVKTARQMGSLTVVAAVTPFAHEGPERQRNAMNAVKAIEPSADVWIGLSNEEISNLYPAKDLSDMFAVFDRVCYLTALILRKCFDEKGQLECLRNAGPAVVAWGPTVREAVQRGWPRQDFRQARVLCGLFVRESWEDPKPQREAQGEELKKLFPDVKHFLGKRIVSKILEDDYRVILLATGLKTD
jgi:hypothetical protein